jgi:hypothetical protein
LQKVFLSKTNSIVTEKQYYMLHILTYMVFFGEIPAFLYVSQRGQFGTNSAYLHFETPTLQIVFLSKIKAILTGKQCAPTCHT